MLEREDYKIPPSGLEEIQPPREITRAEQKANWVLPIAGMFQHDVLSLFVDDPKLLTGVFIGPWTRGFVEANAFRIACIERGIEPQTIFLIDINVLSIDRSIDRTEREQIQDALSTSGGKPFMDTGAIKLGDDDFTVYNSRDFIDIVSSRQQLTLPPIVLIKGDAGNPNLAHTITQVSHLDASLLVIGRNVDPIPFSYREVVKIWGEQVKLKNHQAKTSFLIFTATDPFLAEKMYGYIHEGLNEHQPNHSGTHSDLLRIFTPKDGLLLTFRPNLESLGAHFSDNYIHIIGEPLNG